MLALAGASAGSEPPTYLFTSCVGAPFVQKPATLGISCDGTQIVTKMHWSRWGGPTAAGTATFDLKATCNPSCAAAPYTKYAASITASELTLCPVTNSLGKVTGHSKRRVYGLFTLRLRHPDAHGRTVIDVPLPACSVSTTA